MRVAKFPKPRPIGFLTICTAVLAFITGVTRKEHVLILAGAVFALCLAYCFLAVLLTSTLHKKKAAMLSVRISPEKVTAGRNGTLRLSRRTRFFQMPAVLVRYRLELATKDGKKIEHIFDGGFFKKAAAAFPAACRGAYYGAYDSLVIRDVFGFFRHELRLPQGRAERLLVLPLPSETRPEPRLLASGSERRNETSLRKTDELLEQRPYVPGDDPRRINWKLYSHAGELFVRQEEREPPPHSQFIMIIDTEADDALYTAEQGAAAVDWLCSAALSVLLEKTACGIEALIGFSGSGLKSGRAGELPALLARPYRTAPGDGSRLPSLSPLAGPRSVLVMALARSAGIRGGSLHDFISKRQAAQAVQILFFYRNEDQKNHAEASAILFGRIPGVEARAEPSGV
ncbi:MAG: DUF58 domain-containing protein [Spirochaetaceae bacterium]|nr:DUF58 domain-containing protein [Spirochaetaceae bacterium]